MCIAVKLFYKQKSKEINPCPFAPALSAVSHSKIILLQYLYEKER